MSTLSAAHMFIQEMEERILRKMMLDPAEYKLTTHGTEVYLAHYLEGTGWTPANGKSLFDGSMWREGWTPPLGFPYATRLELELWMQPLFFGEETRTIRHIYQYYMEVASEIASQRQAVALRDESFDKN